MAESGHSGVAGGFGGVSGAFVRGYKVRLIFLLWTLLRALHRVCLFEQLLT